MFDIDEKDAAIVDGIVAAARSAMTEISHYSQEDADRMVKAVAWAIYRDDRALELAEMAVEDTGLGNVPDKITKNKRKTLGALNDLMKEITVGQQSHEPELGLTTYAKPVGVVGTMTPSTNPAATPVNQAMMALKCKNAIIISPSPAGARTAYRVRDFIHAELDRIGAPRDLFQVIPQPINKKKAQYLAQVVDLIIVTGDQTNVRDGYRSGTPCIGVGKGNVPVIIDKSADLKDAAQKILLSKCFDNATSCSSENAAIAHSDIYDGFVDALRGVGGYVCSPEQVAEVEAGLFQGGNINRHFVGQSIDKLFALLGWPAPSEDVRFLIVPQDSVGADSPLSGEKLSLILSLYKADDFEAAKAKAFEILDYEGIGHSVGIHTTDPSQPEDLAASASVARVLVNQAHTFGNGGGFNNSLPFTLSMGCGTWAGNSISENLSVKNFYNVTKLVRTIDKPEPDPEQLFSGFE
ncbi:aldehyde dehydrogenase family protein [Octadecabacter sp. G9-8]|uniref:Aldehyde dehydrogenase family protein n=1 Tax=Octadecabacter dasysiphoniae TaxID=2909341 RepID=A0ABS9CXP5_9RHOB|nr:aldehyde dehydrogenase family protein [Octadecabacter dasysiphoniae]MCF2870946.1 aldehyde dehydrogenase family protein [Octadecabacter dasysiphoniae]